MQMVQNGAKWRKMVQNGAKWCKMVQNGAKSAESAKWCKIFVKYIHYLHNICKIFPQFLHNICTILAQDMTREVLRLMYV